MAAVTPTLSEHLSIVFAGTPEFAASSLRALAESSHHLCLVLTQPDRPKGRGRKVAASPVKTLATELGVPVAQPEKLRDTAIQEQLRGLEPDLMVVAAYGLLLPPQVLAIPRLGCINVHASLLPKWRGAAPIAHAILAGDITTGVSIMRMDEGLDTGPVYRTAEIPVGEADTARSLHDKLAELGARVLIEVVDELETGKPEAIPQPETGASYAPRINKVDAALDWTRPGAELSRKVRAFNPWPVAETRLGDRQLRIWEADFTAGDVSASPGTVIKAGSDGVEVATVDGVLRVKRLQLPGRKPLVAGEFLNACPLDKAILG